METDYVLVGSGLASLAFGALMARAGRRVVVLEAHDVPGGYAHTFAVGPYRFNAQLHYVWNCGPGRAVDNLLGKLGLRDAVTFVRLDPAGYDHMRIPGYALDIPSDFAELARRLRALFPAHASALDGFLDDVRATDDELESLPRTPSDLGAVLRARGYRHLVRWRDATLGDVFERYGLPREARALLALQWPDFMLPPGRLSYFAWVKLFAGYTRGAYYPRGHFHHVIDALAGVITSCGGVVHTRRDVSTFLMEGQRMRGVRAEVLGERGEGTGVFEDWEARAVVCNMDPRAAAERIGMERFAPRVRERLQYTYSASNFVAYCAVGGLDLRAHGFGPWNLFHAEHPDLDAAFDAMHDRGDYTNPSFAVSTPTLVSDTAGDCPAGEQLFEVLTVADHRRALNLKLNDPQGYRALKQHIFDAVLDVLERRYVPGLRAHLTLKVLGSPTTNERYCRAPFGNSYGSAMTPRQVWRGRLDHRSSIEGLYFCNASAGYAGFTGALWTGSRLYEALTGDSVHDGPHVRHA